MYSKQKNLHVWLFVWIALLISCGTTKKYKIEKETGRAGYGVTQMENNLLSSNHTDSVKVYLNAQRVLIGKKVYYNLNVHYQGNDWLKIKSGPSLILVVDGQQMQFSCPESAMQRSRNIFSRKAHEEANYEVSLEDLQKIAQAESVRVKIFGHNGSIECTFTPDNFRRFQEFLKLKHEK
ncbi:MAG: hypothetical protein D6813_11860 [Calditrichaeota bacterium]|nr:MAG: hypothetical protein D6813_11860 [Calditrichota bacterium]